MLGPLEIFAHDDMARKNVPVQPPKSEEFIMGGVTGFYPAGCEAGCIDRDMFPGSQ